MNGIDEFLKRMTPDDKPVTQAQLREFALAVQWEIRSTARHAVDEGPTRYGPRH